MNAQDATPKMVLDALAEANRVGLCSEEKQSYGSDCVKTTIECDAGDWEEYVEKRYQFVQTSVQAKTGELEPYEALDYLRADWDRNKGEPPGPVVKGTCYCECGVDDTAQICTGKPPGTPFRVAEDLVYDECVTRCAPRTIARKCAGSLPSLQRADALVSSSLDSGATCFSPSECAEAKGFFEAHAPCGQGGRCFAAEPAIELNVPFGQVTHIQGFSQYVVAAYRYLISIAAVVATIAFVWGAFLYLIGSAMPSIARGKAIMIDAVVGLIMVFAATMILRTLNPATTRLNPIKVYMVNTIRFSNALYCADLGANTLTADAGTKPSLRPYEEVAADPEAFKTSATRTLCGRSYWVKDAVGSSCDGSVCPNPGEACVSCADGLALGCLGEQRDMRVCAKAIFTGSIQFRNGRYPKEVDLIAVCNEGQSLLGSEVYGGINLLAEQSLDRVSVGSGQARTDADQAGASGYNFEFTSLKLADLQNNYCQDKGGFRGVLLGLVYHEAGVAVNDVAVLSKRNCGGRNLFDGYADGGLSSELEDFSEAIACGVRKGKFLDDAQKTNYWSATELQDALNGKPITCNFSLSDDNAPDDPGTAFCGGTINDKPSPPPAGTNLSACPPGTSAFAPCSSLGQTCSQSGQTCRCVTSNLITVWQCS